MRRETAGEKSFQESGDYVGAKMGMWLFLFTEILFFGGLFLLYAVYRSEYRQEFHVAASELNSTVGALNTVILITSSLFMALALSALRNLNRRLSAISLSITILLGLAFLIVKYFEWSVKIGHGIFPGSPEMTDLGQGKNLFFSLYFVMTGLHGFHVLAGVVVLMAVLLMSFRSVRESRDYIKLENAGLYWHLVDIIWIYLFPLFYLIT